MDLRIDFFIKNNMKIFIFIFILFLFIILYFNKNEFKIINSKSNIQIIFLLLILFSSILIWSLKQKNNEGMQIEINVTPDYNVDELIKNAVIPLDIYETWHTKSLPPRMKECVEKMKKNNPEFTFNLYDEKECRDFIKDNYSSDILNAYDSLIPPAYKADLWRYCILYKNGGIYLDIKFQCEPGFKLIELVDKEYFVLDRPYARNIDLQDELNIINDPNYYKKILKIIDLQFWKKNEIGIYNAVMICKPNNPILFECINTIVKNVKNKFYGYNDLYISGPGMLGEKYFKGDYSKLQDFEIFNSYNGNYIISKKKKILSHYNEYRIEQSDYGKKYDYHELWRNRKIYAENKSNYFDS